MLRIYLALPVHDEYMSQTLVMYILRSLCLRLLKQKLTQSMTSAARATLSNVRHMTFNFQSGF